MRVSSVGGRSRGKKRQNNVQTQTLGIWLHIVCGIQCSIILSNTIICIVIVNFIKIRTDD